MTDIPDDVMREACRIIETHSLPCPECGVSVMRPKCALDFSPAECPRHVLRNRLVQIETAIARAILVHGERVRRETIETCENVALEHREKWCHAGGFHDFAVAAQNIANAIRNLLND